MERCIEECLFLAAIENAEPLRGSLGRYRKRDMLAVRRGGHSFLHVGLGCEAGQLRSISEVEELILALPVERSPCRAFCIDRRVELLQRRLPVAEAEVDEDARQNQCEEDRTVAVYGRVRWKDDGLFATPLCGVHHARSRSCIASSATLRLRFLTSATMLSKASGVSFWPVASGRKRLVSMRRMPMISVSSVLAIDVPAPFASSLRMSWRMSS